MVLDPYVSMLPVQWTVTVMPCSILVPFFYCIIPVVVVSMLCECGKPRDLGL